MHEEVILVDEHDQQVGVAEKILAHQQALLHRAFSIFIIAQSSGERYTLLQQRQLSKYHCPGLWTNACCSHPRPGETVMQAAKRRLPEEMGLAASKLVPCDHFIYRADFENGLTEYELDHVLCMMSQKTHNFTVNPDEVMAVKWVLLNELIDMIDAEPAKYTPWLKPATGVLQSALANNII